MNEEQTTARTENEEESSKTAQANADFKEKSESKEQSELSLDDKALEACKQTLAEWQGKYARLSADFENYKKRMAKEQTSWMQVAQVQLLTDLLPIIDNFERAMAHSSGAAIEQPLVDGMSMIYNAFLEYLKKAGVKEVPYDSFDPAFHEALMQVESADHKSGDIVQIMEKGYALGDRVLRPAKISVAK